MYKFILKDADGKEVYKHCEPNWDRLYAWGKNSQVDLPKTAVQYLILDDNDKTVMLGVL